MALSRSRLKHPWMRAIRPEPPAPFFKTAEGRRIILFGFALIALIGTLLGGVHQPAPRAQQGGADSQPASRPAVVLNHPPTHFAPPTVVHMLRAVQDGSEDPFEPATAAAVKWIYGGSGPESKPAPVSLDPVDINVEEAIAFPDAFRGGHVRASGKLVRFKTLGNDRVSVSDGIVYRGWLVMDPAGKGVMFDTIDHPPEKDFNQLDTIEIDGIFVQTVRYEAVNGRFQTVPYLVASKMRVIQPGSHDENWKQALYKPMIGMIVVLAILATFFFYSRFHKDQAPRSPFRVRPPGPGSN